MSGLRRNQIVYMPELLAMRRAGTTHLLEQPRWEAKAVPVEPNKFRQFCKLKGISGKGKKKFRKAQRELASARHAQAERKTAGGLIRDSQNR